MRKTALMALGLSLLAAAAFTQEKKLQRKDLPPAVQKTVQAQSAGATIRSFSTEVEDGKRIFEAQMTINGRSRDISMDRAGNVLEIEDEVTLDALPDTVRRGLTAQAAGAALGKIEALSKHGKVVAYETTVSRAGRRHEIQVGPDGRKLAHPE